MHTDMPASPLRLLHIAMTWHAPRITHYRTAFPSFRIETVMSTVPLSIPPVINVDAEIDYWRRKHADGHLKPGSFGPYIPWIKFACNSLITHPRATDKERHEEFQKQYALLILPRLSEDEARDFVDEVWERLYLSSRHDQNARPRLGARA